VTLDQIQKVDISLAAEEAEVEALPALLVDTAAAVMVVAMGELQLKMELIALEVEEVEEHIHHQIQAQLVVPES